MKDTITIFPAFGRKYKNKEECLLDFNAQKDFKMYGGGYCSKIELIKYGIKDVYIKYRTNFIIHINL